MANWLLVKLVTAVCLCPAVQVFVNILTRENAQMDDFEVVANYNFWPCIKSFHNRWVGT